MGAFLIANFGIPEFLRSIPGHSVSHKLNWIGHSDFKSKKLAQNYPELKDC
jgi:hypothetical protein